MRGRGREKRERSGLVEVEKEKEKKRSINRDLFFFLLSSLSPHLIHRLEKQVLESHATQVSKGRLCPGAEPGLAFRGETAGRLWRFLLLSSLCRRRRRRRRSRRHCDWNTIQASESERKRRRLSLSFVSVASGTGMSGRRPLKRGRRIGASKNWEGEAREKALFDKKKRVRKEKKNA